MKKTILVYGLPLAGLTILLKMIEYKFMVRDISMEIYLGIIALFFTIIGVWAGTRIINRKTIVKEVPVLVEQKADFVQDEAQMKKLGISPREYEVLQLMSEGLSNQEIGEKLFISLPTVKTHTTNLYMKLDVKRRTQAVQRAKEMRLIP